MADIMNPFDQTDATLRVAVSPKEAGTAGTNYSPTLDLGPCDAPGVRVADFELRVSIPELTAEQTPEGATVSVALESSNDADFATGVETQTVADLAGGASEAFCVRRRIPADAPRYWRLAVETNAATSGTIADAVFRLEPTF
ncbi:MAG: hypothetical protein IKK39_16530 [Thermoguttaceae bacterium]|nr:hypothetical protein [Thermoguttaceae bacterium]MBR4105650.1 hypothetical protein [Thermoguttaceae bacterium]